MSESSFNEAQKQQFEIAAHLGVSDEEIRQHPEWSSTFMNYFINREKEDKKLSIMYEIADMLTECRMPCDSETIGNDWRVLHLLIQIMDVQTKRKKKWVPLFVNTGNEKQDVAKYRFSLLRALYGLLEKEMLLSGRYVLDDMAGFDGDDLMAEGYPEVGDILTSLGSMCQHKTESVVKSDNFVGKIVENIWQTNVPKLGFDDMNIRGRQILDALEYAGGNVWELYQMLNRPYPESTRDPNLVAYVNACAARRIQNKESDMEYIAVCGGASFCHMGSILPIGMMSTDEELNRAKKYSFRMTAENGAYEHYLSDIKPITVDYKQIDVISNTPMQDAIKAAKARGFQMLRMGVERPSSFGSMLRPFMMYNPDTAAFIYAGGATQSNACYSGIDLDFWAEKGAIDFSLAMGGSSGSINGYEDVIWHEYSYNNGLFAEYDNCAFLLHSEKLDFDKIGFGIDGMRVMNYFAYPYFNQEKLSKEIGGKNANMLCDMGLYYIGVFINYVLAHYDTEIDTKLCSQYAMIQTDKVWDMIADRMPWYREIKTTAKLSRIAQLILKLPDSEYEKYYQAVLRDTKNRYEREVAYAKSADWPELVKKNHLANITDNSKLVQRYRDTMHGFRNDEKIAEIIIEKHGVPITELGVKLPWL